MKKTSEIIFVLIAAAFLPRLIGLGQILTVDEPLWQGRGATFIRSLASGDLSRTLVAGQPGVTTAWLVGLSNRWGSLAAQQSAVALATGLLILITTYFLTQLWGFRWGIIAGFLLALDPFLLGHSRLVHTDALLALSYLASAVAFLVALEPVWRQKPVNRRYLIYSAILGALALLTKMFAVILLPTLAVIGVYAFAANRAGFRALVTSAILWLAVFSVTVLILWPALWFNADAVLNYLSSRLTLHASGTRSLETTSRWWYYLRETFFRSTLPTLVLAPPALLAFFRQRGVMRRTTLALFLAGIGYAILLSFSADKSDRYILFTHLTLALAAVFGMRYLRVPALVIIGVIAFLTIDTARLHPYYLAHYNRAYPVEVDHKLGWGEGLEQAAQYIQTRNPGSSVASYYHRVFSHFYTGPSQDLSGDSNADYVVLYRSMFERGLGHPDTDLSQQFIFSGRHQPEHIITINGLPYVWIYPN